MNTACVLCEVWTKILHIIYKSAMFKNVNSLLQYTTQLAGATISQSALDSCSIRSGSG